MSIYTGNIYVGILGMTIRKNIISQKIGVSPPPQKAMVKCLLTPHQEL